MMMIMRKLSESATQLDTMLTNGRGDQSTPLTVLILHHCPRGFARPPQARNRRMSRLISTLRRGKNRSVPGDAGILVPSAKPSAC